MKLPVRLVLLMCCAIVVIIGLFIIVLAPSTWADYELSGTFKTVINQGGGSGIINSTDEIFAAVDNGTFFKNQGGEVSGNIRLKGAGKFLYDANISCTNIYNGTDTDFCTDATGGGGGGADVKSGTVSMTEGSTAVVEFATAFTSTPVLTANVQDAGEYNPIQIIAISTTQATLDMDKMGGGQSSTYTVGWIATDAGNA